MKFDTSSEAHDFIETVHARVGARNQAVLGRAALFLALGEGVPTEFKPKDAKGVTLNDEQVVGEELRDVVRAALNHRAGRALLDESSYRQVFRQHFEYGCQRLKQLWEEADNDQAKFISTLLKIAGDLNFGTGVRPAVATMPVVETEIKLKMLTDPDGPQWSLNGPGTSNGLLVISGQPGTGKSQHALDLLAQLANYGVRFVFFDMKGELEDDPNNTKQRKNRSQFLQQTGARYVRLIRQDLPINPLLHDPNPTVNAQFAYEIASLIRAFAPQLGAKQERNIADVYQHLPSPDFVSLADGLEQSGATGVDLAIVKKIVDFNLFASAHTSINPEEWLNGSIVVDFKGFGTDNETKALAVALILNFLIKKLGQQLAVKNDAQPITTAYFLWINKERHSFFPV